MEENLGVLRPALDDLDFSVRRMVGGGVGPAGVVGRGQDVEVEEEVGHN